MPFKDLFATFLAGTPIKRKPWKGYWKCIALENDIEIHTKDGKMIYFGNTENLLFTLAQILEDDWEVATNENCDIEVK